MGKSINILAKEEEEEEEEEEEIEDLLNKIKRGEKIKHFETERKHKDGHVLQVSISVSPMRNVNGNVVGAATIARDISKIKSVRELEETNKNLEQEIKRRVELEKKLKAQTELLTEVDEKKNDFIAILSHELRNPLTPIISSAEAAKLLISNSENSELNNLWGVINRQANHLKRLLKDLLDVSRMIRGKIELQPEENIDLAPIIANSVETVKDIFDKKRHHLEVNLPAGPIKLNCDSLRLEQILTNVLNNAGKYTNPGGFISITVETDDKNVRIKVKDNGIGIDPESQTKIFVLFSQGEHALVQEALNRREKGFGIGLSLSLTLAKLHGGDISVFSEGPNKGSEFTVTLPLRMTWKNAPKKIFPQEPVNQSALASKKILVVDDVKDLADAFGYLLQKMGHRVKIAYSGPEAIKVLQKEVPDIVFLDISMPDMNGYDTLLQMKKTDDPLTNTKFIAMTGFGQPDDLDKSQKAGFNAHLTKPVLLKEVEDILRKFTDQIKNKVF